MDYVPPVASPPDAPRRLGFPVVAIGASAGGLPALTTLLRSLPAGFDAALVVVTHTASGVKSHLAEVLAGASPLPVRELSGSDPAESGGGLRTALGAGTCCCKAAS